MIRSGEAERVTVERSLDDLRGGRMVVLCHGAGGAYLVLAAALATPDSINFMVTEGRGLVSLALTPERCDQLRLPLIPVRGESPSPKAFTVSIEAREGVTTGISAADRARTIRVAADPDAGPADICSPGHVFPLQARPGGVFERRGEAEAAVDLARLAGLDPAGVLCEILDDEGRNPGMAGVVEYCERHGLSAITIPAIVARRRRDGDGEPGANPESGTYLPVVDHG